MEGQPGQARVRNRRADDCAQAICLINGDQRATIQCAVAIAAIHRQRRRARRCPRWRRCRSRTGHQIVPDFQAVRQRSLVTRKGCGRSDGASLHAALFQAAIVYGHPVEHVKEALVLVERYLKVGCAGPAEIVRAPFDIERPVRRGAVGYTEDAFAGVTGVQVVLIRQKSCDQTWIWQRTGHAKIRVVAYKLQVPVGAHHPTVKSHPVKAHRERERDGAGAIVAMNAQIGHARSDRVPSRSSGEIGTW